MKKVFTFLLTLLIGSAVFAQLGIGTSTPDASAKLDVSSTSKGFLPPRMTQLQRDAIASPAAGLMIYQTAPAAGYYHYNGTAWVPLSGGLAGTSKGDMQYWNGTAWAVLPVGLPGQFLQLTNAGIPAWAGVTYATLTTSAATSITGTTTASGGNVTTDGGGAVTARGVCWSTSANPTTANSKTTDGTGTGIFTSAITGLTSNTIYYIRAYATNSLATVYGNEVSFTTAAVIATLSTTAASAITTTTAASGGNITANGGAAVTARGVCWSTSTYPTTANSKTSDGTGTGIFTSAITGLTPGATYYVRAYATNTAGTAYGTQVSFTATANLPTLSTTAASAITTVTATSGGNITADGGAAVTVRGVCWSTSANPTTADSKTLGGTGTGTFTSAITGLTANTIYYVRAYATNNAGTAYGTQVSFTTSANLATLSTTAASAITSAVATSGGNITADGGATVTARGICISTSANPTIANSKTSDGTGTGTFTSAITGLTLGTTYYVRAYATNSAGTAYGTQVSFLALAIGDSYQGGKVAYLLVSGDAGYVAGETHGLIVPAADQSTGTTWGCKGTAIAGADGLYIGSGNQNTIDIMAGCSTAGIAARLCGDLVLNGYSDWYLPTIKEFGKLYANRVAIGGFTNSFYWSSSESSSTDAWGYDISLGFGGVSNKGIDGHVRACRLF